MIKMIKLIKNIFKNNSGMAMVEMALAAPIMVTLLIAGVEVSRYVQLNQKIDRAATTIADVITQGESISSTEIDKVMSAMDYITAPYPFLENGKVIISRVYKDGSYAPTVAWQYVSTGGIIATSHIGSVGGTANIPPDFTMIDKEDVIIAEVFYKFEPVLAPEQVASDVLYKVAYLRPRLGGLQTLASN